MLFDLCYYGSMQPSEVLNMFVSDIDWMHTQLYEKKKTELEIKKQGMLKQNG